MVVGGHPYDDAIRKGKRITPHERDLRLATGLESGTFCRGDICLRLGLGDDRCGMVAERGAAAGLALVRAIMHGSGEWHDVRGCARDMGTGWLASLGLSRECCMPGEHGGAGLACWLSEKVPRTHSKLGFEGTRGKGTIGPTGGTRQPFGLSPCVVV